MELSNNYATAEQLYQSIEKETRFKYSKPIGEIKLFNRLLPENDIFKLCNKDNILSKKQYPELYSVIGDMYASMINRTLQEDEFAIPNLEGRYLCMRSKDGTFELTPDSIQAFALETVQYYAYFPNNNITKNYFKSILDQNSKNFDLNRFVKPVKSVIVDIKDKVRKTVSSKDKIVYYYIRVR